MAFLREQSNEPHCCDLTKNYFREMLSKEARKQGFNIVRWPFHNREQWMAIGEANRTGKMAPGSIAVLCHAWSEPLYEKECVPAWDFYPVLDELMAKHDMIYPHPELDQLHSEKRYTSKFMSPTRFLNFARRSDGTWKVQGQGSKPIKLHIREEMAKLKVRAEASGLRFQDIMLKQGLSWGGEAVMRLRASNVPTHVTEFSLPEMQKLPQACDKVTFLLQAKLEIVSELRWCMVNGELRSREWKSLGEPKLDKTALSAGYQNAKKARKLVEDFVKEMGRETMEQLEERMGEMCKKVYAEAVADAGGVQPLCMRVDLLLDRQYRIWLGERESWGADINGNDTKEKMNPTMRELANKMIKGTKVNLRKGKHVLKVGKRKSSLLSSTSKNLKRRKIISA